MAKIKLITLPYLSKDQEKFLRACRDEETNKQVLFLAGRQTGKTFAAAGATLEKVEKWAAHEAPTAGMVIAPNYSHIERSQGQLEEFLRRDPDLWSNIETRTSPYPQIRIGNHTIQFRSADNPKAIRGENVKWMWAEELGFWRREAWIAALPLLLRANAQLFATTTPPPVPLALNWVYQDIYKNWERGEPGFQVIRARSRDVPKELMPPEAIKRLELLMGGGHTDFAKRELDAEWVEFGGLVFKDFNEEVHTVFDSEALEIPNPLRTAPTRDQFEWISAGMDFGLRDPTVLVVIGYANHKIWVLDEFYSENLSPDTAFNIAHTYVRKWGIERIWADEARPDLILMGSRQGLPILGAAKGKDSIHIGIKRIQSLLHQRRFYIHSRCAATIDEFHKYVWRESLKEVDNLGVVDPIKSKALQREKPIDIFNHAIDAIRYALQGERNRWGEVEDAEAQETDTGRWPAWLEERIETRNKKKDYYDQAPH